MVATQSFDTVALNNLRLLEGAMVDILPIYLVALGDDPRIDPKPLLARALVNVAKVLSVDADNDVIDKLTGSPDVLAVWEKARSVWLTDDLITKGLTAHDIAFDDAYHNADLPIDDPQYETLFDPYPSKWDEWDEWYEPVVSKPVRPPANRRTPPPVFKGVNKRLIEKNGAGDPLFKVEVSYNNGPSRTVYHAHTSDGFIHNFATLGEARKVLGITHGHR